MATAAAREMVPNASDASVDVNGAMRRAYRGRRCPRWRMRDESGRPRRSTGGSPKSPRRAKTLLVDADGGEPFEKVNETKDGIVVWMRASDDVCCAAKEVMAVATFRNCTARQFCRAVRDVERYAEFVPFVQTSFAVERAPGSELDSQGDDERASDVVWAYNRVKLPVASARDYCVKIVSSPNRFPEPKKADASDVSSAALSGVRPFVSTWEVDERVGPEPRRDAVRLRVNRGAGRAGDAARGGCAVTYRVLSDPGASTPGWLIDVANKKSVPEVLRAFERRAKSGVYEAEDEANAIADAEASRVDEARDKEKRAPRFFFGRGRTGDRGDSHFVRFFQL